MKLAAVCLVLMLLFLVGQHNVESCKARARAKKQRQRSQQQPQHQEEKPVAVESCEKKLSVLLLASFSIGHQFPLIALGEELVRRGHNVTMMGPITEGSSVLPNLPESVGIKFIATSKVTQDPQRRMTQASKNSKNFLQLIWNLNLTSDDSQDYLIEMWAKVDSMNGSEWDYVVTDIGVNMITQCIEKKWGPKVMMNFSPLPVLLSIRPPWPHPYAFSTSSDKLTFKQRLTEVLFIGPLEYLGFKIAAWITGNKIPSCKVPLHMFDNLGIATPILFDTVIGFEYPKIIFPLQHYVGPILPKTPPPLGKDLLDWLRDKESVVYISMGSTGDLTPQQAQGLLEGVMTNTNYSVVWALRKNNRDCLEGMELNRDRLFMSEWVSQVAMLQHRTTTFAILHCGIGGVQEALINSVPVICLPYAWDQFSTAIRLISQGLGARILPDELSRESVEKAIQTIENGDIRKQVKKMSKILKMAGGAEKAADLVEFYADVGHDHGVPAYIRYEWNWIVYYNLDVYVVLIVLLGLICWVSKRLCRCCLRKCCCCCCSSTKTKID